MSKIYHSLLLTIGSILAVFIFFYIPGVLIMEWDKIEREWDKIEREWDKIERERDFLKSHPMANVIKLFTVVITSLSA
jgi:hypothetical protein